MIHDYAKDPPQAQEEPSVDWEEIKQVREIFNSLGKAVKALKIYPEGNPLRERFVREMNEGILAFLKEHGHLVLRMKRSEMFYQDQVVYSNPVKEENIALRLYGDGVREVQFDEGLQETEFMGFLQAATGAFEASDDDVTTLLWEKEFEHIRYLVVEEGGESGSPVEIPQKGDGRGSGEGIRHALQEEGQKSESAVREAAAATPTMEVEVQTIFGKSISEIFVLTPEEVARLQQEMGEEAEKDSLTDLTEILFQVLEVEESLKDYTEIVGSVERALRAFLAAGQFGCALPVLRRLKELSRPEKSRKEYVDVTNQAIDRLGSTEAVKELSMALNGGRADDLNALHGYLTLLNPSAILPLTDLLGMLEQMKIRRLLCESLAVLAKDHIALLVRRLQDPHWYVVRNVVYILGKIGDDRVIPSLKAVVRHPELRVRKELVHMLGEMSNPGVGDLLMSTLEDENPQIRVATLRSLIRIQHQTAVGRIREIIDGNDFAKKELSEKKEYFEAIGRLLGNEAIPFLKDHLMKTGWWGRTHLDEMRFCAALGLKRIGTPEAFAVLRDGSASRDKMVRKMSLDALGDGKGNDA